MKSITEEMKEQDIWAEEVKDIKTPEDLKRFVSHLIEDYNHDYGTICHAIFQAMRAAMKVVDRSPQGGITGFQASCIGWMAIEDLFMLGKGPKRLLSMRDMLFPQNDTKFNTISKETWEWLQKEAETELAQDRGYPMHPEVEAHMKSIVAGVVPFGYKVEGE